jgi:hypothetical protein
VAVALEDTVILDRLLVEELLLETCHHLLVDLFQFHLAVVVVAET